jgi:adenosylcobalamin-dependent ribonucleoside-triphosphate reductase
MDMSMLGVGMGFDTLGAEKVIIKEPGGNGSTVVIEDSREGWIDALRLTLQAYQGKPIYEFDFSKIRPEGAPIKTFGGIAPGPEPLMQLVEDVRHLLNEKIGEQIHSTDILDIMCYIGRCVVSGNIRRSALIGLGAIKDIDFIETKDKKLYPKAMQSHRWASNNTVVAEIGDDYSNVVERLSENGEPGIYWIDNVKQFGRFKDGTNTKDHRVKGINPCGEQPLESYELCTLVETFPGNHESADEYIDTLKFAYMYAKTVTLVPTHNKRTNAVMGRNRRIGTSMSGIRQAIHRFGRRAFLQSFCDIGYQAITSWDETYSNWLCVPLSIRKTTVKPAGTTSLLTGAFPGVHQCHDRRYLRLVRWNRNSPFLEAFKKAGYLIEDDYYDESSKVIYFPIEETEFTKSKGETSARDQVQLVADMQHYWSDNAVSCTVTFIEKEKTELKDIIETYEDRLKTITFLPLEDSGYPQLPYISVGEENFFVMGADEKNYKTQWSDEEFKEYVKQVKPKVLYKEFKEVKQEEGEGEKFCEGDTCQTPLKEAINETV